MTEYQKECASKCPEGCAKGLGSYLLTDGSVYHSVTDYDANDPQIPCTAPALEVWAEERARIVREVDEVLIVNWVGPCKDGDYRKALHDLVTNAISEHDDPQISESAAQRIARFSNIETENARLREICDSQAARIAELEADVAHGLAWGNQIALESARGALVKELREALKTECASCGMVVGNETWEGHDCSQCRKQRALVDHAESSTAAHAEESR